MYKMEKGKRVRMGALEIAELEETQGKIYAEIALGQFYHDIAEAFSFIDSATLRAIREGNTGRLQQIEEIAVKYRQAKNLADGGELEDALGIKSEADQLKEALNG